MSIRDINKILSASLQREEELLQLIEELCEEAFGEDARWYINAVKESYDWIQVNGCITSLRCMKRNFAQENPRAAERCKKQEGADDVDE